MGSKGAKQAFANANDPLALTGGKLTGRRVLDPLNVLPGNGRSIAKTALDPLGVFGGGGRAPRYSALPVGRTIVKGGMDTQAPVAGGGVPANVRMKDSAAQAAIAGGQPIAAGMAAAPRNNSMWSGARGASSFMRPTRPAPGTMGATPWMPTIQTSPVAGYADGGKVFDRKPNGKRC